MKAFNTIAKLLTALAAVAGAVYIIATYGEQIVAWAKKIMEKLPKECSCCCDCGAEPVAETVEEPAEEAVPAEAPAEEPAPEVVVAENEPVAEEADFAE